MPITGHGWEIYIQRLEMQDNATHSRTRTYATYQVFLTGQAVSGLGGFFCESKGPGDNSTPGNAQRIEEGRYPLSTWFGTKYVTTGYTAIEHIPMPGLLLLGTLPRSEILIHPGHLVSIGGLPPDRFLSSVGCLNPTSALQPAQEMDFQDSRGRVIALIENLRGFAPAAFLHNTTTSIPNAAVVIDGEPMIVVNPEPAPLVARNEAGGPPDIRDSSRT